MKRELGSNDQQQLEEYFSSIRETENKLGIDEGWIDRPKLPVEDPAMNNDFGT